MKTWQAILLHLGLTFGAAFLPLVKNQILQAALGVAVASATAAAAKANSETDAQGNQVAK